MNSPASKSRQPVRLPWTLDRLVRERAIALSSAIDRSTRMTYNSAMNSYITFCNLHQRPLDPTPETLSFFTVFMSHHIHPNSVDSYLSGICNNLEGFFPDVRHNRNSRLVSQTLAGCKRLHGHPQRRKRALTREDLLIVFDDLTASLSHDDHLFLTQLLTGFDGLLRLGNLVWPDSTALRSYRKLSMRHSVKWSPNSFSFWLPSSKTDRVFEGNRVLVHGNTTPNPYLAFLSYIRSRDILFPHRPELWIRADGSVPTRSWFLQRLHHYFPSDTAGQSLRAGGATDLASCGFSPEAIMMRGRWISDDWRKYVRQHPTLLHTLFFSSSPTTSS